MRSLIGRYGLLFDFHTETNADVRKQIELAYQGQYRVRLWYGAADKLWHEENDVCGRIGRSTGQCKVPLLIPRIDSMGGHAILDHCIVAIANKDKGFLYKAPWFDVGQWTMRLSSTAGYEMDVFCNGDLRARFGKANRAARYVDFMRGERFCK